MPVQSKRFDRRTLASVAILLIIYAWFWVVISHRIGDPPYKGFAPVFVMGTGDFEHFYYGALAMRQGTNLYESGVGGYIYPPLLAFLFVPLTFLSVQGAAWTMLVVNLSLGLMSAWVISKEALRRLDLAPSWRNVLFATSVTTLLAATKLRGEFQMWQTNILLIAAIALALYFLDRRPFVAGFLLGLAFNIKYLPIVYLPYLILRKRYAGAFYFVVGIFVFALLPALLSGWKGNSTNWLTALSGIASLFGISANARAANVDPITIGHSLSITSGISRMLENNPSPFLPLLSTGAVVIALVLVVFAIYRKWHLPIVSWPGPADQGAQPYRGMLLLEWVTLITAALAFSPQTNSRHTSLLLLPFAALVALMCFSGTDRQRIYSSAAAAILFLGVAIPPSFEILGVQVPWSWMGGDGWCMAGVLPLILAGGFSRIAALTQTSPS